MAIDYSLMLRELLAKHSDLAAQRNELDVEMTKLTQLIKAAFNMLTPEQQQKAEQADFDKFLETHALGLSRAVKMAFSANKDEWLTPPQIRDYLLGIGFDFGKYVANPLASIGTTLKRMPPFEVETKTLENGQIAYRQQMGRSANSYADIFNSPEMKEKFRAAVAAPKRNPKNFYGG